jgi:electron transfer flavoprotein beta subunit
MGIKKAKTKELRRLTAAELGAAPAPVVEISRVYVPQKTKRTEILDGTAKEAAAKLVDRLKFAARVL